VCASGVFGQSALFVGDSTMVQLFIAVVAGLGGQFSESGEPEELLHARTTATVCDGQVRLTFVRSEMLLWTSAATDGGHALHKASSNSGCFFTRNEPFVQQAARHADVVILGVGQHYASMLERAGGAGRAARQQIVALFTHTVNHTLSSLAAARESRGRDPSRVLLLGASQPAQPCGQAVKLPRSSSVDAAAGTRDGEPSPSALPEWVTQSWDHIPRLNAIAKKVAAELGVRFLGLEALTAMRADGAVGSRRQPKANATHAEVRMADGVKRWLAFEEATRIAAARPMDDCVHYCMPGVVDTVAQLVYNALVAMGDRPNDRPGAAAQQGAAPVARSSPAAQEDMAHFWSKSINQSWLTAAGVPARLEACPRNVIGGKAAVCGGWLERHVPKLADLAWWRDILENGKDRLLCAALKNPGMQRPRTVA
jgi:hypothetical protein